jgi:hypothetical protein
MREEVAEEERAEHFNDIWSVILRKQEWRVKEKEVPLHLGPPTKTHTY